MGGYLQILPRVVQSVTVDVVDNESFRRAENEPVEVDNLSSATKALTPPPANVSILRHAPFDSANAQVVLVAHQGDQAICKRECLDVNIHRTAFL